MFDVILNSKWSDFLLIFVIKFLFRRDFPRLRKKIKKAVRRDKTAYYDNLAQEMANADENGNPKRSTQLSNS